jgi:hypothetical protein
MLVILVFKGLMQIGTIHCVTRKALEDMAIATNRNKSGQNNDSGE